MKPVTLMIIGGGGRGHAYASFATASPERARVVGVAEPREFHRERLVREHAIPATQVFRDWREAVDRPRLADAVLICTQDAMHEEPAVAFARQGYHILLEKPMAPTPAACRRIVAAAKRADGIFAVCHVLRYTRYTRMLKTLLDAGRCVYACDNDVVDNQVVNLEYANGVTASFTMSAFTPMTGRMTRIGGTRGYIDADSSVIRLFDFVTGAWETIDTHAGDAGILGGHGGGDGGLMDAFVSAVATGDRTAILSGPDETLESHLTVFAAEQARRKGRVMAIG